MILSCNAQLISVNRCGNNMHLILPIIFYCRLSFKFLCTMLIFFARRSNARNFVKKYEFSFRASLRSSIPIGQNGTEKVSKCKDQMNNANTFHRHLRVMKFHEIQYSSDLCILILFPSRFDRLDLMTLKLGF